MNVLVGGSTGEADTVKQRHKVMEAWFDRCSQQPRPTILVVGDIMCDTYLWGQVRCISPEAPVPIFASAERRHVLGGPPMSRRISAL